MKKLSLLILIFLLLIFTTITKNSTIKIEKKIYDTNENIRVLENKYELILLDYNYLSSPEKLLEYQSKYFEKELIAIDINKLKTISVDNKIFKINDFIKPE